MLAVKKNLRSVVEYLIDKIDINAVNDKGETALMLAVRERAVDCLAILIQHKAKLDMRDYEGKTALMHSYHCAETAEMLIKAGACAALPSHNCSTPLIAAVKLGKPEVIAAILKAPAVNIDAEWEHDGFNKTALYIAVCRASDKDQQRDEHMENLQIVKMLLDAGADLKIDYHNRHKKTWTIFDMAEGYPLLENLLASYRRPHQSKDKIVSSLTIFGKQRRSDTQSDENQSVHRLVVYYV